MTSITTTVTALQITLDTLLPSDSKKALSCISKPANQKANEDVIKHYFFSQSSVILQYQEAEEPQ